MSRSQLEDVYERLYEHFGPQNWWPGNGPLEVILGAVLVQNTSWQRVEAAIAVLRTRGYLDLTKLIAVDEETLSELIRPAGYFRIKAKRLKNLLRMIDERYGGSLDEMLADSTDELRVNLLGVNGVGRETADSILLYAAERPRFVVDTYTHRVFSRHGWIDFDTDYDALQEHFESSLPADTELYNEYHALLVAVGNRHCKAKPKCDGCPLAPLLPEGGPIMPEVF